MLRLKILIAIVVVGFELGCVNEPTSTNTNSTSNRNGPPQPASAPAPAAPAPAPPAATGQQLTLPVLDAFFAQENFETELKSKLQLSDTQVARLKTIARTETGKLREGDDQTATRSTKAAHDEAIVQIKSAIGEEKLPELVAFVNERWIGTGNVTSTVPQDTRIVVNAPAFRMDVFEDGRLIKTYAIGIGYPEFPLPTGLRKADTIIFRPSWTPPDEPWVESPNSKVKIGQKIEPGDKLNPLGPIKIPIGLPSLIHGGKSPAKIGTFASHGCVGLTTPQIEGFTELLTRIGGAPLSTAQISEYTKNGDEPRPVKLARPIPVELRYETITVEDGKLHIYRDVYDRGSNTEENLRNVLQLYGVNFDQLSADERAQITDGLSRMARGATGQPAQPERATSREKNTSAKVTRTIKGEKEIVIPIASLAGKGYPPPADLDSGAPAKKATQRTRKK